MDEALEEADQALEGYRDGGSAVFEALAASARAVALWRAGRADEARRGYDQAIAQCTDPRIEAFIRVERSLLAWEQGDRATFEADRELAEVRLAEEAPGRQLLRVIAAWTASDPAEAEALRDQIGAPLADQVHWWVAELDRRRIRPR